MVCFWSGKLIKPFELQCAFVFCIAALLNGMSRFSFAIVGYNIEVRFILAFVEFTYENDPSI